MKRVLKGHLLIVAVLILLVAAACGEEGEAPSNETVNDTGENVENAENEEETQETGENNANHANDSEEEQAEQENEEETNGEEGNEEVDENGNNGENGEEATQQTETLTFYYTDDALMEIVAEEKDVQFTTFDEKLETVWNQLQHPDNENYIAVWDGVELLNMDVDNEQLTIDISLSEEVQFGAAAEGFAVQTLLDTFGQNEEVESIQLLLNGEVEETLAGHVSIDEPISVDEEIYTGS